MEDVLEVMRIKRLPPMGKLVVEVGGHQFEQLSQIQDSKIRQLIITAIGELIVFSDGYQTLVDAGVAPPIINRNGDSEAAEDTSISQRQAAFEAAMEEQRLSTLAGDHSYDQMNSVNEIDVSTIEPAQLDTGLDLAGQVDLFLQKEVSETPELRGRSIHILGDSAGGLTIRVDGRSYSAPSEISDPIVKTAIQNALQEWGNGKNAA